ncbi:MAG: sigma-54-dependent Fis family transcriptional regulator [Spirochaetales bacterium]|nr:sigma-54-dependent Fis family transcriptional regulator [Spirochaetales bacterium]
MPGITVLCIDDEKYVVDSIRDYISDDYRCLAYDDPMVALEYLRSHRVEILIVDYRMPGLTGLDLLKEARKFEAYHTGLLLTAYADKDLLKDVLNNGLVDKALDKPLDLPRLKIELDYLAQRINRRREAEDKLKDIYRLLSAGGNDDFTFIGRDGDLSELWRQVEQVAPTEENVLITGETGTGKDVLARQIHALSSRADKPFIKINCGAIPATLIESELFGHEKGAFSGADRRKFGKIELAHRGTLFLDEIGELPLELQSRLLHVVEDKALERVGGTEKLPVDFRLISATNKPLEKLSKDEFRRDLFYRLSTVHLALPDLKQRRKDLPAHIRILTEKNCRLFGKSLMDICPRALDMLTGYSWPGNIRELDNVLKRVILMKADGQGTLLPEDFRRCLLEEKGSSPEAVDLAARQILSGQLSLQDLELALLTRLVDLCDGKIMEASRKTGIPKDRFYRLQDRNTP